MRSLLTQIRCFDQNRVHGERKNHSWLFFVWNSNSVYLAQSNQRVYLINNNKSYAFDVADTIFEVSLISAQIQKRQRVREKGSQSDRHKRKNNSILRNIHTKCLIMRWKTSNFFWQFIELRWMCSGSPNKMWRGQLWQAVWIKNSKHQCWNHATWSPDRLCDIMYSRPCG